ncbi:hypothetical protein [Pseudocowpox virus]
MPSCASSWYDDGRFFSPSPYANLFGHARGRGDHAGDVAHERDHLLAVVELLLGEVVVVTGLDYGHVALVAHELPAQRVAERAHAPRDPARPHEETPAHDDAHINTFPERLNSRMRA